MTGKPPKKDLVVLTADKNTQLALGGLMSRSQALGIRSPLTVDYYVHPGHDPGVLRTGQDLLRPFCLSCQYALVIMDRIGSGQEKLTREQMEDRIEKALNKAGWGERAAAVVIDPELENWVWSESPHLAKELGWVKRQPSLNDWLCQQGFLQANAVKPAQPKESLEAVLREVRKPRSSSLYQSLAEKVSLSRCLDPAFLKLKTILQKWFPPS